MLKTITTIIATIALAGCVTAPPTACNPYVPDATGQPLYVGCVDPNAYAQPQEAAAVGPAMLLVGLLLGAAIASTSTGSDRHYRPPPSRYRYAPRYKR